MIRVTISMTRAAILIRARRRVSNWASRQREAWALAAQRVQQPIGGGVTGRGGTGWPRAGAGGAVGGELGLMRLDQVLGLAARAVDALVEPRGVPARLVTTKRMSCPAARPRRGRRRGARLPALGGVAGLAVAATLSPSPATRPSAASSADRRPWRAGPGCRRGQRRSRRGCARTTSWPRVDRSGCRRAPGCAHSASGADGRRRASTGRPRHRPASCPAAG